MIRSDTDYGDHLWQDNLTWSADSPAEVIQLVEYFANMPQDEVRARKLKIWGESPWLNDEVINNEISLLTS